MPSRVACLFLAAAFTLYAVPGLATTNLPPPQFPSPVWPEKGSTITGEAIAWDGYTIEIAGQAIRLFGIDTPEMSGDSRGPVARGALDDILAPNPSVICEALSMDDQRPVARCRAGGRDIAEVMVLAGRAFSFRKYSTDYVLAEAEARAAGRGFWKGHPGAGGSFWSRLGQWVKDWVPTSGILLAIVGAVVAIFLKWRDNRRERQAIAAALMGEIYSIIKVAKTREILDYFEWWIEQLRKPKGARWISREFPLVEDYFEVYSAHVARLGLLRFSRPVEIIMFYSVMKEIYDDIRGLGSEGFEKLKPTKQADYIAHTVALLAPNLVLGERLVVGLAEVSGRTAPTFDTSDDA